jgi:hypothetical protein
MIEELPVPQPDQQIEPVTDEAALVLRPWTRPRLQRLNKAAGTTEAKALWSTEFTEPSYNGFFRRGTGPS